MTYSNYTCNICFIFATLKNLNVKYITNVINIFKYANCNDGKIIG